MEPVTHLLTGACLGRAGFNRRATYATVTTALAAEMPDIDTVWSWRGPVEGFAHHRGITHTFLGVPFEAALLVCAVYAFHRWRDRRGTRSFAAPVAWGWLYGCALTGLLSHLLLDYTNNYGLRPFFPFNARWYAGSFVFIFDPVIFLLLVAALVAPYLFGLVGREVGARGPVFRGRGWALAGLLGVVAWWSLRFVEHEKAVDLALAQSVRAPAPDLSAQPFAKAALPAGPPPAASPEAPAATELPPAPPEAAPVYLPAQRVLVSPEPINPFLWSAATDFGAGYQLATVDTRSGEVTPASPLLPKVEATPALLAAEGSPLGRAYLDWSSMPLLTTSVADNGRAMVTFRDPRFMGGWMGEHGRSALVGVVRLDAQGAVVFESMDGRVEK